MLFLLSLNFSSCFSFLFFTFLSFFFFYYSKALLTRKHTSSRKLIYLAFLRISGTLKNDEIRDKALIRFPLPPKEGLVRFEDAPNDLLEDVTLLNRPTALVAPVGVVRAMVDDVPGRVATLVPLVGGGESQDRGSQMISSSCRSGRSYGRGSLRGCRLDSTCRSG